MLEEIIGGLSARSGGECTVAVAGAPGAGKSAFVRGVARALSLSGPPYSDQLLGM